jgi:serine/threonine protein kinase
MADPSESQAAGSDKISDPEDAEYQRLKEVFLEVVDLDPVERANRINSLLPDNPSLRREVERFLSRYPATASLTPGPSPQPERPPLLQPGDVFADRFEVIGPLGQGGMGDVYEVRDWHLGERVALKTLRPDLVDIPRTVQFFRDEVSHARKIGHRNVCKVFDLHIDPKRKDALAFTMERLDGETLRERMEREGVLSTQTALGLTKQMAEGLDALHAEGIVHCDFKPENVIIVDDKDDGERVKITDFGISRKIVPGESSLTTGPAGTLDYMAPEVKNGKRPTPAADLFAFGVVLHEMLTGKRGTLLDDSKVDASWAHAIRRCVADEPDERPRSAGRVVELIERSRFVDLGLAIAAIILAVLALIPWPQPLPDDRHVAVLPIATMGEDEDLQQIAGGLTQTITLLLTQYEAVEGNLTFVLPSEVQRLEVDDPAEALEQFDATHAVRGVLHQEKDRVQLVLAVIATDEMAVVETAVIEDSYSRLQNLQNGAVARLAVIIDARPLPHLVPEVPQVEPGSFVYYLRGIDRLQRSDRLVDINFAEELFNRAIAANSDHALSHAGLARVFWYRYQITRDTVWVEEARESATKALALNPNLAEARITMARVLNGLGERQQALAHLDRARDLDLRNSDLYEVQSDIERALGRFAEAESSIVKAIDLRRGDWQLHKKKGLVLMRVSRYEEAIQSFEEVLRLSPDNVQGLSNLGVALYRVGRLEDARLNFEKALAIERRPSVLTNLGKLLIDQRKYEAAAQYLREAVENRPDAYLIWGNLGSAYQWSGDPRYREAYEKALQCLAKDIAINPRPQYLPYVAVYEASRGEPDRARRALQQALEAVERLSGDELAILAQVYEILGERARAVDLVKAAIKKNVPLANLKKIRRFDDLFKSEEWRQTQSAPSSASEAMNQAPQFVQAV